MRAENSYRVVYQTNELSIMRATLRNSAACIALPACGHRFIRNFLPYTRDMPFLARSLARCSPRGSRGNLSDRAGGSPGPAYISTISSGPSSLDAPRSCCCFSSFPRWCRAAPSKRRIEGAPRRRRSTPFSSRRAPTKSNFQLSFSLRSLFVYSSVSPVSLHSPSFIAEFYSRRKWIRRSFYCRER